jgi:hypothetical protein
MIVVFFVHDDAHVSHTEALYARGIKGGNLCKLRNSWMLFSCSKHRISALLILTAVVGLVLNVSATTAQAQTKKPVVKKPAAAKSKVATAATPKATGPIVLGTTQLAGDFGKLGTTYTIGKNKPLNFTLKSAEYTISPLMVGHNIWVPKSDQKLLVLHYTIHNPVPREQSYSWSEIHFTAVDAQDKNQEMIQAVSREGTNEPYAVRLKPAQKIDVTAAILVPAEGVVPKLIVEREKNEPVIRYDLRDKVAALPAAISPAPGVDAPKDVSAQPGTFYSTGVFDMRLDEIAYISGTVAGQEPKKGERFLTATFTLKNRTAQKQTYYWGHFVADLKDADGEKSPFVQALLKATRDERTDGSLESGEEGRVRFFFPVPENVTGKTVRILECKEVQRNDARGFVFDISSLTPSKQASN